MKRPSDTLNLGDIKTVFPIMLKILLFVYVASKAAELIGADKAGNWQIGMLWTAGVVYGAYQLFKVLEKDHDK